MIQTGSPYYQPTPPPPAPFTKQVGLFPSDPDYSCSPSEFNGCDESWSLIIRQSSDIFIAGAGLYSWFSTYTQTCINSQTCQKVLVLLDNNGPSVRIQQPDHHWCQVHGCYERRRHHSALNSLNVASHPFWSQVSVMDVATNGSQFNNVLWIDPKVWEMPQPAFTCSPRATCSSRPRPARQVPSTTHCSQSAPVHGRAQLPGHP